MPVRKVAAAAPSLTGTLCFLLEPEMPTDDAAQPRHRHGIRGVHRRVKTATRVVTKTLSAAFSAVAVDEPRARPPSRGPAEAPSFASIEMIPMIGSSQSYAVPSPLHALAAAASPRPAPADAPGAPGGAASASARHRHTRSSSFEGLSLNGSFRLNSGGGGSLRSTPPIGTPTSSTICRSTPPLGTPTSAGPPRSPQPPEPAAPAASSSPVPRSGTPQCLSPTPHASAFPSSPSNDPSFLMASSPQPLSASPPRGPLPRPTPRTPTTPRTPAVSHSGSSSSGSGGRGSLQASPPDAAVRDRAPVLRPGQSRRHWMQPLRNTAASGGGVAAPHDAVLCVLRGWLGDPYVLPHPNGVRYFPYAWSLESLGAMQCLTQGSLLQYYTLRLLRNALVEADVLGAVVPSAQTLLQTLMTMLTQVFACDAPRSKARSRCQGENVRGQRHTHRAPNYPLPELSG